MLKVKSPMLKLKYLKFNVVIAAFAFALSASAQTEVAAFIPGSTLDGVNYFLPRIMFKVVVEAEHHTTVPGEFAAYADRYLRLSDVPVRKIDTWEIKSMRLYPYGVPDSTKAINVKVKSKTVAPLVSLTEDGLLLAINDEAEPEPMPELPVAVPASKPVNGRDFMTQEILAAGSTSKMAQLTAEEIYEIRDSRNALLRGEADNTPKDGAQLKLMLDGLAEQLFALESLFKGQTLTGTEVFVFDFDPSTVAPDGTPTSSAEPLRALLCRFSKRLGLVDKDDLSGEPIWMDLRFTGNLPQSVEDADIDLKKAKMEKGVWVNQPARAQVTVSTSTATLVQQDVLLPQFGTTEILSDILFNKKTETRVTFYQHTGSVKDISQ